jgi:hypothetical protein
MAGIALAASTATIIAAAVSSSMTRLITVTPFSSPPLLSRAVNFDYGDNYQAMAKGSNQPKG